MARAGKAQLIDAVVKSIGAAGWSIEQLSENGAHPFRLAIARGGEREVLRIYIWNISHGGGRRSKHEFRIQITGIESFELEPEGKTLILGWSDRFGVFAAFDANRRTGKLGSSPSIQVLETTLTAAATDGASLQKKGDSEFALGVRPDRLATYVQHQGAAHDGDIRAILEDSGDAPDDALIDAAIARPGDHRFGSAEELAQRQEILARIAALEAEVARLRPAEGRDHNNPPELLPAEDVAEIVKLEQSAADLKQELAKETPDTVVVGRSTRLFRQFVSAWRHAQAEAGKLGAKIADKARERAAELVIGTLIGGAAWLGPIVHAVEAIAQAVVKWLGLL